MKQVIWVQGATPAGWTELQMFAAAKLLANSVGGELVKFGGKSHIIIGDDRAKLRMQTIENQSNKG